MPGTTEKWMLQRPRDLLALRRGAGMLPAQILVELRRIWAARLCKVAESQPGEGSDGFMCAGPLDLHRFFYSVLYL